MSKRTTQVAIAIFAAVLASAVIGAILDADSAGAASDKDVFVINTAANPVPVTGDVGITGTPTVDVADDREPFKVRLNASLGDGDFGGSDLFTVPAGKRLVVTAASARTAAAPGQTMLLGIDTAFPDVGIVVPTDSQGTISGSSGLFEHRAGALSTDISFGAGETVSLSVQRGNAVGPPGSPPAGIASVTVHLAGYLVDA